MTTNDSFAAVISEIASRSSRKTKLAVIDAPRFSAESQVTVPGTLTVYVGRKGSNAIEEVRSAFQKAQKK